MAEIKHVGRLKSNQRKVVVAYRVVPGENPPVNSLVIDTATLSDADHDTLIKTVESNSAQTAFEFAEVMARTQLSDGANMLARFHSTGKLQLTKMSDVEMTPNTATQIGLDELNKIIADQKGVTIADLALKDPNEPAPGTTITEAGSVSEMPKPANPDVVAEAKAAKLEAPVDGVITDEQLAAKYRSDADRLYKEAKALRAQAEELVPTTRKSKSAKATA
jgi:hypothetical protein